MSGGQDSLDAPIAAMVDATNRGDSDAFLAAFADDAVLVDWGRTFTGRAQIATWDRNENIGVRSRIEVTGVERDGPRTVIGVRVTGDGYNGGGSFAFETADGRITRMEIRG
jgi:ketosteroid isomerase-like protein